MTRKKILLIDDEKTFAEAVKLNIETTGKYWVRTESKGSEGLAAAKTFKPDLILLDMMMPDMSGDKIAAQLKSCEDTKNIPIILFTALITKEEETRSDGILGKYRVLAKPVKLDKLMAVIGEVCPR